MKDSYKKGSFYQSSTPMPDLPLLVGFRLIYAARFSNSHGIKSSPNFLYIPERKQNVILEQYNMIQRFRQQTTPKKNIPSVSRFQCSYKGIVAQYKYSTKNWASANFFSFMLCFTLTLEQWNKFEFAWQF